eukprot:19305-Chlamydomonas_euryale.AAC.2
MITGRFDDRQACKQPQRGRQPRSQINLAAPRDEGLAAALDRWRRCVVRLCGGPNRTADGGMHGAGLRARGRAWHPPLAWPSPTMYVRCEHRSIDNTLPGVRTARLSKGTRPSDVSLSRLRTTVVIHVACGSPPSLPPSLSLLLSLCASGNGNRGGPRHEDQARGSALPLEEFFHLFCSSQPGAPAAGAAGIGGVVIAVVLNPDPVELNGALERCYPSDPPEKASPPLRGRANQSNQLASQHYTALSA